MKVERSITSWLALGSSAALAFTGAILVGCGDKPSEKANERGAGSTSAAASSAPSTKAAAASATPSATQTDPTASVSGSAPASASAAPAPGDDTSLVGLFKGDVPPDATPRPIFKMSKGSGVIVLVPKAFGDGSGTYGDGYGTVIQVNGKLTSRVELQLDDLSGADPKAQKLTEAQLKQLCYKAGVDKISWEPSADVAIGPDATPAIAWKGKGTSVSKGEWGAYAISTVAGKNIGITGCGTWDAAEPNLAKNVVLLLKSIRMGTGALTDPGNP